jgi:transposase InsO family protein
VDESVPPPPITFLGKVNGVRALFNLDTASSHTFISPALAEQLGVPVVENLVCNATLADVTKSAGCPVLQPVDLEVSGIVRRVHLPVLNQGHDILLGRNLLSQFGIGITGLPVDRPELDSSGENDNSKELSGVVDPSAELDDDWRSFQSGFMDSLQPSLQRNAAIRGEGNQRKSYCTHPDAVVTLPLKDESAASKLFRRQYPIPKALHPWVSQRVEEWLGRGYIEQAPPGCPFNNPLWVVPKKDLDGRPTKNRLVEDPRLLNSLLADVDRMPLPIIDDLFAKLDGACVFTSIDLMDAFHQFMILQSDRSKTAFTWEGSQYMFIGAPMGIKHMSSVVQRVLNAVLAGKPFVLVFVDDIIVFSHRREDHLGHVATVLNDLTRANLFVRIEKCNFAVPSVKLLGFVVSAQGKRVDPIKYEFAQRIQAPTNAVQVQSLLGFFNYLRRHIPLFARIAAPILALSHSKDVAGEWSEAADEALKALKSILASSPMLNFPLPDVPLCVATDASRAGLGACLYQEVDGKRRYLDFASRSLSKSERNYSATKLELLGIVFALKSFRQLLFGQKFTLFTDHRALVYLFSSKTPNPMFHNWLETLLEFDFLVVHRPGVQNILPDHLSRIYDPLLTASPLPPITVGHQHISVFALDSLFYNRELSAPELSDAVRAKLNLVLVPEDERSRLILEAHSVGHDGLQQVFLALWNAGHYWPSMRRDISQVINACEPCQRVNLHRRGYHPLQSISARYPFDHVAVDLLGPLPDSAGCRYALVLVDIATRVVLVRGLADSRDLTVAQELVKLFCDFGFPKVVQSDNGTEFINSLLRQVSTLSGFEHRFISPWHPRANGVAEVSVREIKRLLRKKLDMLHADWAHYLPSVQFALNQRVSSRTKSKPFELLFGRPAAQFQSFIDAGEQLLSHTELLDRMEELNCLVYPAIYDSSAVHAQRIRQRFDSSMNLVDFRAGDTVFLKDNARSSSLQQQFSGPFAVVRRTDRGSYVLREPDGPELLSHAAPVNLKLGSRPSSSRALHDEAREVVTVIPEQAIDVVLEHRMEGGVYEYLVRFLDPLRPAEWLVLDRLPVPLVRRYWSVIDPTFMERLVDREDVDRRWNRRVNLLLDRPPRRVSFADESVLDEEVDPGIAMDEADRIESERIDSLLDEDLEIDATVVPLNLLFPGVNLEGDGVEDTPVQLD